MILQWLDEQQLNVWNIGIAFTFIIILWQCYKQYKQLLYLNEYKKRRVPYVGVISPFWLMWSKQRQEIEVDQHYGKFSNRIFGYDTGEHKFITISVGHPDILQQVLSKDFTNFINRRKFTFNDKVLKRMLFFAEDEQWKRLRSIITPTFSLAKVRQMKPLIDETLRTLLKNFNITVNENKTVDVKRLAGAYTMDTIIKTAFGVEVDSLGETDNPFVQNAVKIFTREFNTFEMIWLFVISKIPFLPRTIRFNKNPVEFFTDSSRKIIEQKRKEFMKRIKENCGQRKKALDFVELMLEAEVSGEFQTVLKNENVEKSSSKFISEDEMLSQCVLFFMAGYDTTAVTIMMSCYNLATHPEAQQKLYDEITLNMENLALENQSETDPIKLITMDSLFKFSYLNAVVEETLRLYSPLPSVERRSKNKMTFELDDGKVNFEVHKDDIINIPIYSIHHDPNQWSEPNAFKPERFLNEPAHQKYSYLPFGLGPRNCVAKSLGLLEAKLALLHIVRNYNLTTCEKTKIPLEFYNRLGTLSPKNIFLDFHKRI